jgi:uncharacterized phage protein gp47/JayE
LDIPTTDEIAADMEAYIRLNHPLLTDFNPLSALSVLVEAVSIQIYQMYTVIAEETERISPLTATGNYLSALVKDRLPEGRQPGTQAAGFLTFSRNNVAAADIQIPIGTIVSSLGTDGTVVRLQTVELGTITVGTTSCVVATQATDVGTAGNIGSYSASYMTYPVTGIDSVINVTSFAGGTDEETDDNLRLRYQTINQQYGTATDTLVTQHLTDLESVWEAHVYNRGYGDVEIVVDYDKTGTSVEIAAREAEIIDSLTENIASGVTCRGALAASIRSGVPATNITECEGGKIWVRPLTDIIVDDSIIIEYKDKATGGTHVATVTIPAMTLKGDAVLAVMQATGDLATSIPTITYSGDKDYDILIGAGTYPQLFIAPRLVPLVISVQVLVSETYSPTLKADMEASITSFIDEYMIGDNLQYSDLYEPIWVNHVTSTPLVGIDALLSLSVAGNLQAISNNGETLTIAGDQRLETGMVTVTLVAP